MKQHRTMKISTASILLMLFGLGTCLGQQGQEKFTSLTPKQYIDLSHTIIQYMECDDCEDGELDSLLKWNQLAIPSLSSILKSGPSPSQMERYRQFLIRSYKEMHTYAVTHPENKMTLDSTAYINKMMENYVVQYQCKAALSLGLIGGADAKKALIEFTAKNYREEVIREVEKAKKRLQ